MPRSGKTDIAETEWLHRVGLLTHEKSCRLTDGRLVLHGSDWIAQVERVWKRDKGKCQICRRPVYEGQIADPDHIVRRSDGGGDELPNLRTTHRSCHNQRHPEKQTRFSEAKAQAAKDFIAIVEAK